MQAMQFFLELFLSLYWCFYQHAVGLNATTILMQVNVAGFRVVNKQENKTREKVVALLPCGVPLKAPHRSKSLFCTYGEVQHNNK